KSLIPGLSRRVLLARSSRKMFKLAIEDLARDAGQGARVWLGSFIPPVNFRRVEIRGADVAAVSAARTALGLEDSADRAAIRVAYRRTLERVAPISAGASREDVIRLGNQFNLLDLVAEGQIRAARGDADMSVKFDPKTLSQTWLLRLHQRTVSDRVA